LFVARGIFRPAINHLLTGILFLFQTASKAGAIIRAKDGTNIFFSDLAALLNVYSRHTPHPCTSIGRLVLWRRLVLRRCLDERRIELLVTLDIGRQIGRPWLPVSNRRLHARI
jgi:hypothetical protein